MLYLARAEREKGLSTPSNLFCKSTNPIHEGGILMTWSPPKRAYFSPFVLGSRFQHKNLGGTVHSNHSRWCLWDPHFWRTNCSTVAAEMRQLWGATHSQELHADGLPALKKTELKGKGTSFCLPPPDVQALPEPPTESLSGINLQSRVPAQPPRAENGRLDLQLHHNNSPGTAPLGVVLGSQHSLFNKLLLFKMSSWLGLWLKW